MAKIVFLISLLFGCIQSFANTETGTDLELETFGLTRTEPLYIPEVHDQPDSWYSELTTHARAVSDVLSFPEVKSNLEALQNVLASEGKTLLAKSSGCSLESSPQSSCEIVFIIRNESTGVLEPYGILKVDYRTESFTGEDGGTDWQVVFLSLDLHGSFQPSEAPEATINQLEYSRALTVDEVAPTLTSMAQLYRQSFNEDLLSTLRAMNGDIPRWRLESNLSLDRSRIDQLEEMLRDIRAQSRVFPTAFSCYRFSEGFAECDLHLSQASTTEPTMVTHMGLIQVGLMASLDNSSRFESLGFEQHLNAKGIADRPQTLDCQLLLARSSS